jgi:hypothetical protein
MSLTLTLFQVAMEERSPCVFEEELPVVRAIAGREVPHSRSKHRQPQELAVSSTLPGRRYS